ncbi:dihydrofolate reductase family protein [Luedemannella flava]|uniref:Dihydrofolate reductase family protein n=1 Tax=Luedemannella flava TaxID=349316 RepID=A0ABN2LNU4_9ACTN
MRTLISTAFVSVDGMLDPTGGDEGLHNTAWTFKSVDFLPEAYELKGREMHEAGALLLGRTSYQLFAPVWPDMEEFTEYKDIPKYVVSTTLTDDDLVTNWGPNSILRSLDDVAALKETDGGPLLVHGSATLNRALDEAGLIDRYHLLVFPILLGAGKPLFSHGDQAGKSLKLVDHEVYANGIQKNVFDVVR